VSYLDSWVRSLVATRNHQSSRERTPVSPRPSALTQADRRSLRGASYEEGVASLSPFEQPDMPFAHSMLCRYVENPAAERAANHVVQRDNLPAIRSAMDAQDLDPGAIKGLQAYLQAETGTRVRSTGFYGLSTARAVHDLDPSSGGIARAGFFAERGLFYFKAGEPLIPPAFNEVAAAHPDGLTVSLYANYGTSHQGTEFRDRAREHAAIYRSMGVDGGAAAMGLAIPIDEVSEVPQRIRQVVMSVQRAWGEMIAQMFMGIGFAYGSMSYIPKCCKVKNVALFAHGMHYGLSMNKDNLYDSGLTDGRAGWRASNVRGLALSVSDVLTQDVAVQLFACNAGNSDSSDGSWAQPEMGDQGGETSYAAKLQEALDATGKRSTVYAHVTAGHTTENVSARVFGADAETVVGDGESASLFDIVFPPVFVAEQAIRNGWTVDQARDKLWRFFKDQIYRGGAPRGNEGMQLFTNIDGKSDEFQDRFEEAYS
jgi:hypothetical protein